MEDGLILRIRQTKPERIPVDRGENLFQQEWKFQGHFD